METRKSYRFVNYLWDDAVAAKLDPVGQLIYRSNLLGTDQRITNTGGGNTSAKVKEIDPMTGLLAEVLWVKGSGGDLRTSTKENFSSLYQERLLALQPKYLRAGKKGPKSEIEDSMVGAYPHCTFNLNPRATSIDTPLHSFVPFTHVDHMHPNAVIAIAASKNSERLTREIFGDDIVWIGWQRPGFDLGLKLQEICTQYPKARGVLLGQHGIINWANESRACYDLTLDLIEKAAAFIDTRDKREKTFGGEKYRSLDPQKRREVFVQILPWLRGQVSQQKRFIGTVQDDDTMLRFVNSVDAPRLADLGTSCPDHFLRTKIKPLYVDWNPGEENLDQLKKKLADGLAQYRRDYASYYNRCKHSDSPAMRDANPTVMLIPGLGMIAWGKDKSESRVTAEFYNCAIDVMRGAEAMDEYIPLPQQEAFDIEYWLLEEAKLKRMPPEKELARQIVAVIGAGSGIGKEIAHRVVREGAHAVCADVNADAAKATAKEITDKFGLGIGVAGTGISNCGPAIGLLTDTTNRNAIKTMLEDITLAYGGIDGVVVTAGVFVPPDMSGHIPDDKWAQTFAVNVTGVYLVADEAWKIWKEQGLKGSLIVTTSANAVVAKKGSLAYDSSKAAANHLVRELALELAPLVRVNGVAPATVVEGSAMFPRDRVIASLAKYKIVYSETDSDDTLRSRLAQFYAERTMLKQAVTPADQAEAVFLLLSSRLAKTTGQILSIDGGLHEAFLR
ncbi:MAG: bifunctional rhamnulose-1-phosphate aldolase/short-chain dehydrogenase [Ignavibacteriales bacterium]|nr:bifunctional rhamnulose-1-phosphate aldolase/short-chain dehydrogenase [Ignavibacteriales bacterium]